MRPLLRPLARHGTRWYGHKYGVDLTAREASEQRLRATLDRLRTALAGRPHLLVTFSYADIAMASMLQAVSPVDDRYIPLGPGTRAAWTRADIARDHADLVCWRDALYENHRNSPARAAGTRGQRSAR